MSDIAVCTIARGRQRHLRNLLLGLTRQTVTPRRVVVAVMGGPDLTGLADGLDLTVQWVDAQSAVTDLPLAAARNAAREAAGDAAGLIFLDVDVIPSQALVADYARCLNTRDGVFSGHVEYLPPMAAGEQTDDIHLAEIGRPHPTRPCPTGTTKLRRPELFWSLSFALSAATYDRIGGFDPAFIGYGAEDTDFALRADAKQIALWQTSRAVGWHQHHGSITPPVNHLQDIVANAHTYRRRWARWPMEGWLTQFDQQGWVRWTPEGTMLEVTPQGVQAQRDAHVAPVAPSGASR